VVAESGRPPDRTDPAVISYDEPCADQTLATINQWIVTH
jgi:hypothetical protein